MVNGFVLFQSLPQALCLKQYDGSSNSSKHNPCQQRKFGEESSRATEQGNESSMEEDETQSNEGGKDNKMPHINESKAGRYLANEREDLPYIDDTTQKLVSQIPLFFNMQDMTDRGMREDIPSILDLEVKNFDFVPNPSILSLNVSDELVKLVIPLKQSPSPPKTGRVSMWKRKARGNYITLTA